MPIFNAYQSKRGLVKPADYSTGRVVVDDNGKWKADNDCWITYYLYGSSTSVSELYINGAKVDWSSGDHLVSGFPGIYINKGDTVELVGRSGYVKVYGCR